MSTRKTNIDIDSLWEEYFSNSSEAPKSRLMLHYIWLVKYILGQMNLPVNSLLDESDYLGFGILGLSDAIDRYQVERGVKFESYAIPRIRGSIQDELRKLDWLSRSARKKASDYLHAAEAIRSRTGQDGDAEEIRKQLNVTPEQYKTYLNAAAAARASLSLNEGNQTISYSDDEEIDFLESLPDSAQTDQLSKMAGEERINYLTKYLSRLPEKKRLVMMLYYYEELNFKDIGVALNVSESRVCQIHTEVIKDLKNKLRDY
ncbi:MAG: FliA/WhiG family RNA polymerase sigma factor [Chloroflexota bacterium]